MPSSYVWQDVHPNQEPNEFITIAVPPSIHSLIYNGNVAKDFTSSEFEEGVHFLNKILSPSSVLQKYLTQFDQTNLKNEHQDLPKLSCGVVNPQNHNNNQNTIEVLINLLATDDKQEIKVYYQLVLLNDLAISFLLNTSNYNLSLLFAIFTESPT